jgi:hypothetical protein
MTISADDTSLYVASTVNVPGADSMQVYRYMIQRSGNAVTGLTFVDTVTITNMRFVTSIAEDPGDGTLYVLGYMAPTFDPSDPNPDPADGLEFTTPMLARVPYGSVEPEWVKEVGLVQDPDPNLALGLSMVWLDGGPSHTLDWTVNDPAKGRVEVVSDCPAYRPGSVVELTGIPVGNNYLAHWVVVDPEHPDNPQQIDDNPLHLTMDLNYEVKAVFRCGTGMEPLLPIMLGLLVCCVVLRRK